MASANRTPGPNDDTSPVDDLNHVFTSDQPDTAIARTIAHITQDINGAAVHDGSPENVPDPPLFVDTLEEDGLEAESDDNPLNDPPSPLVISFNDKDRNNTSLEDGFIGLATRPTQGDRSLTSMLCALTAKGHNYMSPEQEESHLQHWLHIVKSPDRFLAAMPDTYDYFDGAPVCFLAFDLHSNAPVVLHSFGIAMLPTGDFNIACVGDFCNGDTIPDVVHYNPKNLFGITNYGLPALDRLPEGFNRTSTLNPQKGKNNRCGETPRLFPLLPRMAAIMLNLAQSAALDYYDACMLVADSLPPCPVQDTLQMYALGLITRKARYHTALPCNLQAMRNTAPFREWFHNHLLFTIPVPQAPGPAIHSPPPSPELRDVDSAASTHGTPTGHQGVRPPSLLGSPLNVSVAGAPMPRQRSPRTRQQAPTYNVPPPPRRGAGEGDSLQQRDSRRLHRLTRTQPHGRQRLGPPRTAPVQWPTNTPPRYPQPTRS